jgi:hypothetical protein
MANVSKSEQDALSFASGSAAIDSALSLLKTDREAIRAAHWNSLPMAVRRIAVMSANMPKERANDPLKNFNALERGRIALCVRRLSQKMEVAFKAMQGGELPDTTGGDRQHQANGITAVGTLQ